MEWLIAHGDALAIVTVVGGFSWRASARITRLESKVESIQQELIEAKASAQRNFDRIYSLIQNGKK